MPDLKSELKKLEALKFDDDGDTSQEIAIQEPAAHESISETMFRVIRDNPGCSRARLTALAKTAGVSNASSSSLMSQFVKRGLVRTTEAEGVLTFFAASQTYKPGYVRRPKKAAKVATPKVPVAAPKQEVNVSELLSNMSILKARALYDELKQIFGN